MPDNPMTDNDQRRVLEQIAQDEEAYPRDRIAAVRALREMAKEHAIPERPEDELERILTK